MHYLFLRNPGYLLQQTVSFAEAEYNAFSACLQNENLTMNLTNEISSHINLSAENPQIKCQLFDRN